MSEGFDWDLKGAGAYPPGFVFMPFADGIGLRTLKQNWGLKENQERRLKEALETAMGGVER